jgi:hypothetical protein
MRQSSPDGNALSCWLNRLQTEARLGRQAIMSACAKAEDVKIKSTVPSPNDVAAG